MIRLTASDFYTYHRPSQCDLRVYLRHKGEEEAAPSPYEMVIRRLGQHHERTHLASYPSIVDLSEGTGEEREIRTRDEVGKRSSVLYQPRFSVMTTLDGVPCQIVGEPDFLLDDESGRYVIRDCKISRRITEEDHPEILRQLEIYGWLLEQSSGEPPGRLEATAK